MVQVLYKGRKRLVHIGKNGGKYVIVQGTKRYLRPKTKTAKKKPTKTKTAKKKPTKTKPAKKKKTKTKMKGGDGTCRMCRGHRKSSNTHLVSKNLIDSYLISLDDNNELYGFKTQRADKKWWNRLARNSRLKICQQCYDKLLEKFKCNTCNGKGTTRRQTENTTYVNEWNGNVHTGPGEGIEEITTTRSVNETCSTCNGQGIMK
jgi:hypothetical protein